MRQLVALIFAVAAFCGSSSNAMAWNWTEKDSMWQLAYLAVHVADWGQTRDIAAQCEGGGYYETNPVLGRCPSAQWVNTYFLGTALLHTGLAHWMPGKYRRMFQAATIGMEVGYVTNNARIGLNVRF